LEAVRADTGRPYVRYLEGSDGIEHALFETLDWPSPIHGILSMQDLEMVPGAESMRRYIDGRRDNGLWLKVIRSHAKEGGVGWPCPIHGDLAEEGLEMGPGAESKGPYIDGRRDNGLWLKVIRSQAKEGGLGWPSSSYDLRELRVAPAGHDYPMSMLIGERTVS